MVFKKPFSLSNKGSIIRRFWKIDKEVIMDLREKKTKRNIRNAFIKLRAKKPLERISIKELAELAEISKATFYLHYKDIYDLSENLQKEVIDNVLNCISRPNLFLTDEIQFTKELFQAFHSHDSLIEILFSGSQSTVLPIHIENALKDYIFKQIPEYKDSAKFNIMLSYRIQGGFHAYRENYKRFSLDDITETITYINKDATMLDWT